MNLKTAKIFNRHGTGVTDSMLSKASISWMIWQLVKVQPRYGTSSRAWEMIRGGVGERLDLRRPFNTLDAHLL